MDLAPGEMTTVTLPAGQAPFDTFGAHPEVGGPGAEAAGGAEAGGEHGSSAGGGEAGESGHNESGGG